MMINALTIIDGVLDTCVRVSVPRVSRFLEFVDNSDGTHHLLFIRGAAGANGSLYFHYCFGNY